MTHHNQSFSDSPSWYLVQAYLGAGNPDDNLHSARSGPGITRDCRARYVQTPARDSLLQNGRIKSQMLNQRNLNYTSQSRTL